MACCLSVTIAFGISASMAIAPIEAAAAMPADTARSEQAQRKRADKLAALGPGHFARVAKIDDDGLEAIATISSIDGFREGDRFGARVNSDNFVRAMIDKSSGEVRWQIYQIMKYGIGWRNFTSANLRIGDKLVSRQLDVIARDVDDCSYGMCMYAEIVGIPLEQADVDAIVAASEANPGKLLDFRYKAQNGLDWDDDIPLAEIAGIARVVADYQAKRQPR